MSYIDICNSMRLKEDGHKIHIYLQYDCYRLLELLLSDYEAVIYREKGLKDIENMIQFQSYLPDMELHYFLSNNPVEIIKEMQDQSKMNAADIDKWMDSQKNGTNLKEFINICDDKRRTKEYGEKIERNTVKYACAAREFTEQYLGEIYSLWKFLEM